MIKLVNLKMGFARLRERLPQEHFLASLRRKLRAAVVSKMEITESLSNSPVSNIFFRCLLMGEKVAHEAEFLLF